LAKSTAEQTVYERRFKMNTFTSRITDFLIKQKQDAILTLFKDNEEYSDLRKTLNSEMAMSFEQVKEDMHRLYDMESDMLYLQGFKDCIQLLKLIEVL